MASGTIDNKGRLSIPREMREALGLLPGIVVFFAYIDGELRIRRADDPYGPIAQQVVAEYRRGLTTPLEQVAAELGIDLAAVEPSDEDDDA